MVREEDRAYYEARVVTERNNAATAADPAVAGIHLQLAECYERLLAGLATPVLARRPGESPVLSVVTIPGAVAG